MGIVITEFMSLDGVVQAPGGPEEDTEHGFAHGGWSHPYFDPEVMGAAFDSARRLYSEIPSPPTEGFDLVARELAQRNPKLRDFDTSSAVDLQFVRELEQSGFLKSLKQN